MKKISLSLFSSFLIGFYALILPTHTSAQTLDYACMGRELAQYMNTVIADTRGLGSIRLLSPVFNMTSPNFEPIAQAMDANTANWTQLYGIAGNVYNASGRTMTDWIDEKIPQLPSVAQGKPLFLTEIGEIQTTSPYDYDLAAANLASEIAEIRSSYPTIEAALVFNGFGNNSGWGAGLTNEQFNVLCGGSCNPKVGVNSAVTYTSLDYQRAGNLGMAFTLEIANNDTNPQLPAVMPGIRAALSRGMAPIIRIGVGSDSGGFTNPQTYVTFLTNLNAMVSAEFPGQYVYAIAGPNEPESEPWATIVCGDSTTISRGSPLDNNFLPFQYACSSPIAEFHSLRPYPASPMCDPLIPRTIPTAPQTAEKKYNTLSCGTSLTPQIRMAFDEYGDNTYYENIESIGGGPGGSIRVGNQTYAHTWCDTRPGEANYQTNYDGGTITCWRTIAIDVTIDLGRSNLGILGNTQTDVQLTDAQKVNEYISWYLSGATMTGAQTDRRLVNFAGPAKKLLPKEVSGAVNEVVAAAAGDEVHSYNQYASRLLLQQLPVSSLEDVAGEFVPYAIYANQPPGSGITTPRQNGFNDLFTADLGLIITDAGRATPSSPRTTPRTPIPPPPPAPPPVPTQTPGLSRNVMLVGDSITAGTGTGPSNPPYGCWLGQYLETLVGVLVGPNTYNGDSNCPVGSFSHAGFGGYLTQGFVNDRDSSQPGIQSLAMQLAAMRPGVVVIHLGSNDVFSNFPLTSSISNLRTIINEFRTQNPAVRIILSQVIPMDTRPGSSGVSVAAFNNELSSEFTGEPNVTLVRSWESYGFDPVVGQDLADFIHPSASGSELMAQRFRDVIAPLLPPGPIRR